MTRTYRLVPGSCITDIMITAGGGSYPHKPLGLAEELVNHYQPDSINKEEDMEKWFSAEGRCVVDIGNGKQREAILQWCENPDVGAVKREIKEWL